MASKRKQKKASRNSKIVPFEELPHSPELLRGRKCLIIGSLVFAAAFFLPINIALKLTAFPAGVLFTATMIRIFIGRWMSSDANIKYLVGQQETLQNKLNRITLKAEKSAADFERSADALKEKTANKHDELERLLLRKTRLLAGEKQLAQAREARKRRMLAMADKREQGLQKLQELEIETICRQHKEKLAELDAELTKLNESESQEIQAELSNIQEASINEFLCKNSIKETAIIGLNTEVVDKLAAVGVLTARDLSSDKLDAVNVPRANTRVLLAWQQYLYQQADLQKPMFVKKTEKIRNKYLKPRQRVEAEQNEVQAKLRREPGEIRELFAIAAARLKSIESEIAGGTLPIEESEMDFVAQLKDTNRQCDLLQAELADFEKIKEKYEQEHDSSRRELDDQIAQLNSELGKITLPTVQEYLLLCLGAPASSRLRSAHNPGSGEN